MRPNPLSHRAPPKGGGSAGLSPRWFANALVSILLAFASASPSIADEGASRDGEAPPGAETSAPDDGFRPLFNGRDLDGWVPVNVAPSTFTVRDGMIHSTGVPTGLLRTERQYENFVLELEWSHRVPGGNAGLFVWSDPLTAPGTPFARAIEIQILDGRESESYTSHGDIFSIHGARMTPDRPHPKGWERCLPSEKRCRPAGEWNRYRVTCRDGRIKLEVDGKEVSGGYDCSPRKGYIVLESEGGEVLFRNLRIRELPSTGATEKESAPVARGFRSLYNGLDLTGWRLDPRERDHWQAKNWILAHDGGAETENPHLRTEEELGDFELIIDWRLTRKTAPKKFRSILPNGDIERGPDGKARFIEALDAGDSGILLRGSERAQVNIWCHPIGSGEIHGYRGAAEPSAEVRQGATPRLRADHEPGRWNRFFITLRGDRVTVDLNGKRVIENAHLPGIPARGPLVLQHHDGPIEFASILVRELPDESTTEPRKAPESAETGASATSEPSEDAQR